MIKIVTDSASDLPKELVEELDIEIVPLTIRFGDEEFVDRRDLTPTQFWSKVAASPVLPETAAPSPGAFEEAFRRAAEEGAEGVVCITLSADLSATHGAAQVAAHLASNDVPVAVLDSRNVSMGQGWIAVAAARMAQAGKELPDCLGAAEDSVASTRVYGAFDTLENLRKGGRISLFKALSGSLLDIKPIIEVAEGKVKEDSMQRTRSKSLDYLVDKVRQFEPERIENLAVMHGDAPDLANFLDRLDAVYPVDQILVTQIGAVVGSHAGPRVMGVAFQLTR